MQNIPVSDTVFQALQQLATARNQTPAELVAEMVAQQQWEEHAAAAIEASLRVRHQQINLSHKMNFSIISVIHKLIAD